jgi:flagellar basal-body rod protein FlgF
MSRDLYAALSGARASLRHLDSIANNLSNTNTAGFKAERITFEMFEEDGEAFSRAVPAARNDRNGALRETGSPTDLGLQGPGWFLVDSGAGPMLTRDGHFALDPDGVLVSGSGMPVQGVSGSIVVPAGESLRVDERGVVYGSESGELDRLQLVQGPAEPMGGNLWRPTSELVEASPTVVQGTIEDANVDAMGAMVELIEASRFFEAFQKIIQASDELDARLNELGGR